MAYERPGWAAGPGDAPAGMPQLRTVTVDISELVRTRDAVSVNNNRVA